MRITLSNTHKYDPRKQPYLTGSPSAMRLYAANIFSGLPRDRNNAGNNEKNALPA